MFFGYLGWYLILEGDIAGMGTYKLNIELGHLPGHFLPNESNYEGDAPACSDPHLMQVFPAFAPVPCPLQDCSFFSAFPQIDRQRQHTTTT